MLVKITVGGTYSDFEKQLGFSRSQELEAGTVIDYPGEYGLGLVEVGLAEAIEEIEPAFAILEAIQAEEGARLVEPSEAIAFEVVEAGEGPKASLAITDTAKKLLDKHELDDLTFLIGTGAAGKITLRDAKKFVEEYGEQKRNAEHEANEA